MNAVGLIIYPAGDMAKTTQLFATLLGTEPYHQSAYYTGFKSGDVEIGLVPKAAHRMPGPLPYVTVDDIKTALAALNAAGAETIADVMDVGNGLLVASVKDADGSPIGLRQFPKST